MTAAARVTAVRSVEVGVGDLGASAAFYRDPWLLEEVARRDAVVYFRGTGPEHYIWAIHADRPFGWARINLAAADRASVDALYERLAATSLRRLGAPQPLDEPGGGYGCAFDDGEEREFRIVCGVADHRDASHVRDRAFKISHIVLNSDPSERVTGVFCDVLGFRLRDKTARSNFLGCNADHHSLAFGRLGGTALNHVAFEVPSLDGVMRAVGRLKKAGVPLEWGVGRHGPGDNVFAYFVDPDGYAVEYTTEMQQVDDESHVAGTPESWARVPHSDAWGVAEPPTQRFLDAIVGRAKVC